MRYWCGPGVVSQTSSNETTEGSLPSTSRTTETSERAGFNFQGLRRPLLLAVHGRAVVLPATTSDSPNR
jgi:hypothetical protein